LLQPALKICGLRHPTQAAAVAALGVQAIGVIGVPASPRYLEPERRMELFDAVTTSDASCRGVLVVADPSDRELDQLAAGRGHRVLQLHGEESPSRCQQLRSQLGVEIWKALRIRSPQDLQRAQAYGEVVDALLLDAWVADQLGGTGHSLPLEWLSGFASPVPWWLAGGIRPESVGELLGQLRPDGLDVSSGVETSPGEKNLERVSHLLMAMGRPPAPERN
jgi:phosphoribosylanthranilate isomerase